MKKIKVIHKRDTDLVAKAEADGWTAGTVVSCGSRKGPLVELKQFNNADSLRKDCDWNSRTAMGAGAVYGFPMLLVKWEPDVWFPATPYKWVTPKIELAIVRDC
jgi:hypothetical protein